jgi:hypothetical protein
MYSYRYSSSSLFFSPPPSCFFPAFSSSSVLSFLRLNFSSSSVLSFLRNPNFLSPLQTAWIEAYRASLNFSPLEPVIGGDDDGFIRQW